MVKKILNFITIPFKFLYKAIKIIVTFIAKNVLLFFKTLFKLIKYFIIYFYTGVFVVFRNLYLGIKFIFVLLYKIISSFFIYTYTGIKVCVIFIYKVLKNMFIYFFTGLNGIFIGIKKLFLFISKIIKKIMIPIKKNIKKRNEIRAIKREKRRIKKEEEDKKKEQRRLELKAKRDEEEKIREQKRLELKAKKEEEEKKRIEAKLALIAKQAEEKEKKRQERLALKANEKEANKKKLEEKRKDEERKNELRKQRLEEKSKRANELKKKRERVIIEKLSKKEREEKEKKEALNKRKENVELIKKAKEEQKLKARSERVPLEQKIINWYNNLAFVRYNKNKNEMNRQVLTIDFEGEDAKRSEEKILYKYVARNMETGKVEKGQFAAFSKLDVHSYLLSEGYEVYEIMPQKHYKSGFLSGNLTQTKMKKGDLVFFLTQLSTFLKSGVPLLEAIKILQKQTKKRTYKQLYRAIIYELTMGENFSESLSKQGDSFPKLLINMVKSSELTGNLPETLDDMAVYYEETEKTRKQMLSAMMYPAVIFVFATIIVVFIMIYVIPQFVGIYSDMQAELPAITLFIIHASDFLKANILYVILVVLAFIILFRTLYRSIKVFKTLVQWIMMHIPIIGKIIIYNEVTMFTKTFGSLLNHNVFITESMEVLSKITNNEVYKMLIFDTITNLSKGEAISNSFKNHWAFPVVAYEMLLTGEKTGQLGDMMNKVSNYYQLQHKNAVNQIKTFIEPVMIVFLAGIVGTILLSVMLPMFNMYSVGL